MEVCIKYKKKDLNDDKIIIVKNFIVFLNKEYPLKKDVTIQFTEESEGNMTTGLNKKGLIKVLSNGRMLIEC
jgi:hypothetical protein